MLKTSGYNKTQNIQILNIFFYQLIMHNFCTNKTIKWVTCSMLADR